MPVADMFRHDDRVVDHEAERDRDPCQRIKLHFQPQQIVKNHRDTEVDREADDDQQQIFEFPCDQQDKNQQDQDGKSCANINLVQLVLDKFSRVIAGVYFITGRK